MINVLSFQIYSGVHSSRNDRPADPSNFNHSSLLARNRFSKSVVGATSIYNYTSISPPKVHDLAHGPLWSSCNPEYTTVYRRSATIVLLRNFELHWMFGDRSRSFAWVGSSRCREVVDTHQTARLILCNLTWFLWRSDCGYSSLKQSTERHWRTTTRTCEEPVL